MENVNKQLLERWAAFGKAMQKAGSELPRHLIADTEQAIAAAEQAQQAETERADKAEEELRRINRLAQCGTVQNFLALSDDEKGKAFAVMMRTDKAQIDMINELEARADANERDAERYRWLRTADPDKIQDPGLCEAVGNLPAEPTDVDDAVDQAMRNL